jgi:hypothetical protein
LRGRRAGCRSFLEMFADEKPVFQKRDMGHPEV